jgi:hypothetical protein
VLKLNVTGLVSKRASKYNHMVIVAESSMERAGTDGKVVNDLPPVTCLEIEYPKIVECLATISAK